jgi:hypothetical protein
MPFMKQSPPERTNDVRAPFFYLAHSTIGCPRCDQPTSAFAIVLPKGHEIRLESGGLASGGVEASSWEIVGSAAMLFYVDEISAGAKDWLKSIAPNFGRNFCRSTGNHYWTSICEHCGHLMEDHNLHCEPGGAFLPRSDGVLEQIHSVEIPVAFSASAVGYTNDPAFMHAIGMADAP